MILLTNKTLQYLIYNQLYSAGIYELLATQAPTEILQTQMKLFQQDSLNNASYLDRYYQDIIQLYESLLITVLLKRMFIGC